MIAAALLICLSPVAIDGDTVRCGGAGPRIRIWGVQAPEKGQPGYLAATRALAAAAAGGMACQPQGTSYSRIVARCFTAAGIDVGRALIASGHVVEWCRYSRNAYGGCK